MWGMDGRVYNNTEQGGFSGLQSQKFQNWLECRPHGSMSLMLCCYTIAHCGVPTGFMITLERLLYSIQYIQHSGQAVAQQHADQISKIGRMGVRMPRGT